MHLAETREKAREQARKGAAGFLRDYTEGTNGRKPVFDGPRDQVVDWMSDNGFWIVGTPDDCIEGINNLARESGGFGGFLVQTVDWAPRESILHSYELLARYVMPQFQGSVAGMEVSNQWAKDRVDVLMDGRMRAIDKAKSDYSGSVNIS